MQISHQKRGEFLLVKAKGRLDASWADHFSNTLLDHIRNGHHHLVIDGSDLSFLSSAGIRSLVNIHKALLAVQGEFHIIHATSFVSNTLRSTGFGMWLAEKPPAGMPDMTAEVRPAEGKPEKIFTINAGAKMTLSIPADWKPWQKVVPGNTVTLRLDTTTFALGIGTSGENFDEAFLRFGEFMAVCGNVVYQPPTEGEYPDFLLLQKDYVPELLCIQALQCTGGMSHLLRFSPGDKKQFYGMGEIVAMAMETTGSETVAFLVVGEVDGLVGSALIRSPGLLTEDQEVTYPETREWLSFCGERLYARQQALVFGIAQIGNDGVPGHLLPRISSCPGMAIHAHASVFPYQPLMNGRIDLATTVQHIFNGPPPLALLHLVDDDRPAVGLGESAFTRGACWCAPINNREVLV